MGRDAQVSTAHVQRTVAAALRVTLPSVPRGPGRPRCLPGGRACRGACRLASRQVWFEEAIGIQATHTNERLCCCLSTPSVETSSVHSKNCPSCARGGGLKNKRGKRWRVACDAQAKGGKP
jgi:hypothetical protein